VLSLVNFGLDLNSKPDLVLLPLEGLNGYGQDAVVEIFFIENGHLRFGGWALGVVIIVVHS
jgi:hypothetical protein